MIGRPPLGGGALASALAPALFLALSSALAGCTRDDCLGGTDERCVPAVPCAKLAFTCAAGPGFVEAKVIGPDDRVPGGLDALGSVGDVLLRNDRVAAVIDALDHPHYLAPTGGALLDLSTAGGDDDALNHVFQATGLLPGDAAHYTALEIVEGEGFRAVVVRGHLEGDPGHQIATRYELRPCEPGLRVRTELVNRADDDAVWTILDGWYWSGREALPFTPSPGAGFEHPSFTLTTVEDVFRRVPFLAASGHALPSAAYAEVACDADGLEGFHSDTVSALGPPRVIVPPRDGLSSERFLAVASGNAIAPAVDVALEVRRQLFGERSTEVRVALGLDDGTSFALAEARAVVTLAEGTEATPRAARIPWTEAVPASDGQLSARVPSGRPYVLEVEAFGRVVATKSFTVGDDPVDLGTITLPAVGRVQLHATLDGRAHEAEVHFYPADEATRTAVEGRLLGRFDTCAPLLGAPHGGSPACNRVLTRDVTTVAVPPGRYDVYATAGLFGTLVRRTIEVRARETVTLELELKTLPLLPEGTLSADFHVHGRRSFDSSIPDDSRVLAFLASGIDVIAATDHDAVSDYADAMERLGAKDRLVLMSGVETTGHILFRFVPDAEYPKVIGHWNFWPVPFDPKAPRGGAPVDDLLEPGALFDAVRAAGMPESGVIELNHPMSLSELGRDLGWARAIGLDLTKPLLRDFDGTEPSLFFRTPPGARSANSAYHAQEVMNGTANDMFLPFRAFWFYLLDQGVVRAGTANSDSHGLTDDVLGVPRNVVWTSVTKAAFDAAAFNADVKRGHMIGTNGPIIEVTTTDSGGATRAPSTEAFAPGAGAKLHLRVSAAPWVPIDEVRVVVNGAVAKRLTSELAHPGDPFATTAATLLRFEGDLDLAALLPSDGRDAWIVVEAGAPLPVAADLDCNGIPDTGDNDGDGVIDWRDVDVDEDGVVDLRDADRNGDGVVSGDDAPSPCDPDQDVGPLPKAPPATSDVELLRHFTAVVPGGYPLAFTNPLLLDRDGGGWSGPGLPARGTP